MSENKRDYDAKEVVEGKGEQVEDDFKQVVTDLDYFSRKYGSSSSSSSATARMRAEAKSEGNDTVDEDIQRDMIRREVDENRSTVDLLRKELENYLGRLDAKTDSEGNKLISVPDNFGSIVNAMTREDLLENNATSKSDSWVQYLLADHVNQQMHHDFQGRYDNMLKSGTNKREAQIKKGLAEISLLDRQLYSLTKKKTQIDKDTAFLTNVQDYPPVSARHNEQGDHNNNNNNNDEEDDDAVYEDDDETESRASQSMAGTPSSAHRDRTFLTKARSHVHSTGSTPRSARLQAGKKKGPLSARIPDTVGVSKGSPTKGSEGKDQDEDDEDGLGLGKIQPHQLTELQKNRIEELLDLPDEDLEDYIPRQLQEQDEKVTHELERFGRLDRLLVAENMRDVLQSEKKADFLAQQRKDRKQKEHEKKIEQLLLMCSHDPVDYSLIAEDDREDDNLDLENDTASRKSHGCRSMYTKALHEVPSVEDVHMEVPITRSDILALIEGLKLSLSKANGSSSSSSSSSSRPAISSLTHGDAFAFHNHDVSTVLPTPNSAMPSSPLTAFSAEELDPSMASRADIEQLLSSYRTEINRLTLAKYRKLASREEAERKLQQQQRPLSTNNLDEEEEEGDAYIYADNYSRNQQQTPRSARQETQAKSAQQQPISGKKSSPSPRKSLRQQPSSGGSKKPSGEQFTLESNLYHQQQQYASTNPTQESERYHKEHVSEFIGKVFDDEDLKMLPDLLRDDKVVISLPPIPSARDAQGNKKPSIQFVPPVPIMQTSRRVKPRPSSSGGSAKSSARDAEYNPYRIHPSSGLQYEDDHDEDGNGQFDPTNDYDYNYNCDYDYQRGDSDNEEDARADEPQQQRRRDQAAAALRQSLVDQVRKVVEC